jgi:hypothetical protein
MPRYSVLLPTRNGASLLEGCLRSVLAQDYSDFELVISDNASDDGTAAIVARAGDDPRVKVLRQPELLDVTSNWNAALAATTGDRIVLLGDDDVLLDGYFERADELMERHGEPDVLLYNAYAYAFPGFEGSTEGHWADPFYSPEPWIPREGDVPRDVRRRIVQAEFAFQFPMHLNMQTALVQRHAAEALPAGLFKPPFPDFYALTALLLTAERWVMSPEKLVVVGVSPKSFGRTINNAAASIEAGKDYLGIDPQFPGYLPGSQIMNGHYETLLALKADLPREFAGIEIARDEYAWQQAYSWYAQRRRGSLTTADVGHRLRMLEMRDWAGLGRLFAKRLRPGRVRKWTQISPDGGPSQAWPGMQPIPEARTIAEFAEWLRTRGITARQR